MGIPAKRRTEILDEIARLGKQQKETARLIISTGRRSPNRGTSYDERARRIAELVLELAGLDQASPARSSETQLQRKSPKR